MSDKKATFRYADRKDVPMILRFIKSLASYEKMSETVCATEELLKEWLFDRKRAEVLFVMVSGKEVGFSLFYQSFSAYLGRGAIYIDDLYIDPAYRGRGYGKALLKKMAEITLERGCGRLEWCCLNWNQPSINFYRSMGAVSADDHIVFQVFGEALINMTEK